MEQEKEALAFIGEMAAKYFEQRDMYAIQEFLEERTSWIGTGRDEFCRNLEEAKQTLAGEIEEYGGTFRIDRLQYEAAVIQTPACVVYGTITAVPDSAELSQENIRFTAVTEHTDSGSRLLHLHFSHADPLQERGQYYVPRSALAENEALRSALAVRVRQLENLTTNIPGGAHQCMNDSHFTLLSMSDGFLSMFGYTREEIKMLFQDRYINMVYSADREQMLHSMKEQMRRGADVELEYRVMHKSGRPVWILDKGRLMDNGEGGQCFYCLLIENNDRKCEQEELRLSLERHQVIMNQAADIIFEWDIRRDTLLFSQNWRKKFGYDAISGQISGRIPLSENIHPDDMDNFVKLMKDTAEGISYSETEFRIRNADGIFLWCRIRATTQYDENKRPIKAVGVIVDIDEEKRQRQALQEQAQRDALTGLYNKATINVLVEQRMQKTDMRALQALLIIDVDYFKSVNDTYGHLCGDGVLSDVAEVLKAKIRSTDLAGRIGGDEFLIYFPEVSDDEAVRKKLEQLISSLRTVIPEEGAPPVSCSIGAAVFPRGAIDYLELYQCADQALYFQKNNGRGGFSFYNRDLDDAVPNWTAPLAVGTAIGSDEGNVMDEQMAQYAFRTLYTAKDIESVLNRLMEIIGRSFGVSRVYIFESSEDGTSCSNSFEWCGQGIRSEKDKLQNLSYLEDLDDYLKNFDHSGIFYCADIREMPANLRSVLEPQGICSMLQCAMLDEGNFAGFVGFDECRNYRAWNPRHVSSFKLTADVLSTFLIKMRQKKKLLAMHEADVPSGISESNRYQ